jgi:hypothetical protein
MLLTKTGEEAVDRTRNDDAGRLSRTRSCCPAQPAHGRLRQMRHRCAEVGEAARSHHSTPGHSPVWCIRMHPTESRVCRCGVRCSPAACAQVHALALETPLGQQIGSAAGRRGHSRARACTHLIADLIWRSGHTSAGIGVAREPLFLHALVTIAHRIVAGPLAAHCGGSRRLVAGRWLTWVPLVDGLGREEEGLRHGGGV